MRKLVYIVILTALFFAPVNRVETGKLLPVRAVAMYLSDGQYVLETDAEYKGQGFNLDAAINQLKTNTPAVIYLDTAEFLLVAEETKDAVSQLIGYFKPNVKVCICDAKDNVATAAEYASVHGEFTKLRHWETK